jgi:hypothetical protein
VKPEARRWGRFGAIAVAAVVVLGGGAIGFQDIDRLDVGKLFNVTEAMIPMRDGIKLHTIISVPKSQSGPLPILYHRTPYGVAGAIKQISRAYSIFVDEPYILVTQDIRGRYGSEGTFVMQRPIRDRHDPKAIDESSDAYDTIEWLLAHVPNHNGRVGMFGVSYDGWLTVMAALDPHPALKAVSPQASPSDMWVGDDFHHNGAFRLSYGFEYAAEMETGKVDTAFAFDRYDTYPWYLALGPLANANAKYLHGRIPTWNNFVAHPNYDAFWKQQAVADFMNEVRVPTLNVAGFWDQEDFYGPVRIYDALEQHDTHHLNYLVVGPWNHGGWWRLEGNTLGAVDFGSATSRYFREHILAPWFAYFLKDKGTFAEPEAITFEAGANEWRSWDAWPPRGRTTDRELYVRAGGALSFDAPPAQPAPAFDSYVSDPAHPVPYRHRPIQPTYFEGGSLWSTWLVEDQRFVDARPDVACWETAPLADDLTIAGRIVAHLFASTTGSDSDWVVKLIDVYPESYPSDWKMAGYELMVANDVLRGRFRRSREHPEAVVPGAVTEYTIDLHTQDYRFKKGHRIMVQVQSTWFPLIDRNPQTYVPNIFEAKAADFRVATQRVYRSGRTATHVTLPVMKEGVAAPSPH